MPHATILRDEVWGRQESEVRKVFELTHLKWSPAAELPGAPSGAGGENVSLQCARLGEVFNRTENGAGREGGGRKRYSKIQRRP